MKKPIFMKHHHLETFDIPIDWKLTGNKGNWLFMLDVHIRILTRQPTVTTWLTIKKGMFKGWNKYQYIISKLSNFHFFFIIQKYHVRLNNTNVQIHDNWSSAVFTFNMNRIWSICGQREITPKFHYNLADYNMYYR